ncbi:MAG: dienelactone hydrolase family protein, partial [Bacteroidota bacterium]|nr:dienelactone hydrolase family protein [Bacteroidota bacterium]
MKALIALLFAFANASSAQEMMSCDSGESATAEFAALGGNAAFVSLHEAPAPFTGTLENGKMISFKTSDGKEGQAYFVPSQKKADNVLFVFQEWWGLNDYIKQRAEELQKELGDVNVYALDLYDGKVASEPNEAAKIVMSV